MSLELVDRILRNWEDPNYRGFNETLSHLWEFGPQYDLGIIYRTQLTLDNCRYLRPNKNVIDQYETNIEGLRAFYKDHNMIEVKHERIKINGYKIRFPPFAITIEEVLRHITPNTKYILDTSRNGGYMALSCLINSNAYVISVDNVYYEYDWYGKSFIDAKFPGRSLMISNYMFDTDQNRLLIKMHPDLKLDVIYINIATHENQAYKNIVMYRRFATENTVIILESVCPHQGWGIGQYTAMNMLIEEGVLLFIKHMPTDPEYTWSGLAILKYNFDPTYKQKLTLQDYINMEINVPLMEFTQFVVTSSVESETPISEEIVRTYQDKFAKYGLVFDEYLKKILKEKHNIII